MMVIENEFEIGQEVFLKTDPEQLLRLVVSVVVEHQGVRYGLVCGDSPVVVCQGFEISKERVLQV